MITPNEKPITNVIREAILNNIDRNDQYLEIMRELVVTRAKAKQLFFAFLWFPTEEYLTNLRIRED